MTDVDRADAVVSLRGGGCCVVLDLSGDRVPTVLHWGRDVGPLSPEQGAALKQLSGPAAARSSLDAPFGFSLFPVEDEGWSGTPGIDVTPATGGPSPRLRRTEPPQVEDRALAAELRDADSGVHVSLRLGIDRHGVLCWRVSISNEGSADLAVRCVRALLPLPTEAVEILDLSGRWCRESSPQRHAVRQGTWLRTSRRGRPGHDSTLLMSVGTSGFGFGAGEVWSAHLAWSGDQEYVVEELPERAGGHSVVLGAGELLRGAEITLRPGQRYDAPDVLFVWSGDGLDGISQRVHARLRSRSGHPSSPRPLTLNTWEAVYFDTDVERWRGLAELAARIGVERFVIDDGWFRGRSDDHAGLGDWFVDELRLPDGLHPIVDHVRGLGMQVGLWFEPEMVNTDSDLVRSHPDWVLAPRRGLQPAWRNQHVLDLAVPQAWDYLLERIDTLVAEYGLDYLKWDHNRDLHDAVHPYEDGERPSVHAQTAALYRLLDELRRRHPALEIESCASGGGRVDLGILERTDRVWASDCIDAIERQLIQRGMSLLLPPELVGSHVGGDIAHTTYRHLDLSMRLATALFAHAGIEWDLTACTPQQLERLTSWSRLYKELRPLLHSGHVVRLDHPGDELVAHGVVAADGSAAVYSVATLVTGPRVTPGRLRLRGLDRGRVYRLRLRDDIGEALTVQAAPPAWMAGGSGITAPGGVLVDVGLELPIAAPGQALVIHVVDAAG